MDDPGIDVAICLDARMRHAAFALLASIKAHASARRPVRVHVVIDVAMQDFADLARAMNDGAFEIVVLVCANPYADRPVRDYLTAALYLRFQLPTLLPDVDRILYLDVDIVVDRGLEALFDTDLRGHAVAAVPDWAMLVGSRTWPTFRIPYGGRRLTFDTYALEVLDLDCAAGPVYFNTGVLVIDLAAWRRDDLVARTLALLDARCGLYFTDQDALNAVLRGAFVALDMRWNAHAACMRPAAPRGWFPTRTGRDWSVIGRVWHDEAWIVHFAGPNKPWVPGHAATARDDLWWRYAALSPMGARICEAYRAEETPKQRTRSKLAETAVSGVAP